MKKGHMVSGLLTLFLHASYSYNEHIIMIHLQQVFLKCGLMYLAYLNEPILHNTTTLLTMYIFCHY